jgi:hypothetical protein
MGPRIPWDNIGRKFPEAMEERAEVEIKVDEPQDLLSDAKEIAHRALFGLVVRLSASLILH